jgi:hypothetical protein
VILAISLAASADPRTDGFPGIFLFPHEPFVSHSDLIPLTFVSVLFAPERPDQCRKFKLCIASWLAASSNTRVLLFMNGSDFRARGLLLELELAFGRSRIAFAGRPPIGPGDLPFVRPLFAGAIALAKTRYVCVINGDIALSGGWMERVSGVVTAMRRAGRNPVVIGQRRDFDLRVSDFERILRFARADLLSKVDEVVESSPHKNYFPDGVDWFVFSAVNPPFNVSVIPDFIIRVYHSDACLTGWLTNVTDTVSIRLDSPVYDINHVKVIPPELADYNWKLCLKHLPFVGTNLDTRWRVEGATLVKREGSERITMAS